MSQYYDESLIGPEKQPKQRGCFFYGCLFAVILTLLAVVGGGIAAYMVYRYLVNSALPYTDTAPIPMPQVELPPEQAKELHARVDAFKAALDSGKPTEPLVLTSDEINTLIADNPDFRDRVHVDLEGDKVKGQVSIPLERTNIPAFKGRYLNGKATLKVSLEDGLLLVTLDSLEVKGKPIPPSLMDQIRSENLAKDVSRNPENAEAISKLESIQVKDGKIIMKARAREGAEAKEGGSTDDEAKPKVEVKVMDEAKPEDDVKAKVDAKSNDIKPEDDVKAKDETKPQENSPGGKDAKGSENPG